MYPNLQRRLVDLLSRQAGADHRRYLPVSSLNQGFTFESNVLLVGARSNNLMTTVSDCSHLATSVCV